ncbi:putative odorant receptor 85e [Onthophagus taurus]|uniref:putative odorant receptor 85e n=1 Tax=Onthophagus taurus TaxID=166361 RepID=UPI0039BE1952
MEIYNKKEKEIDKIAVEVMNSVIFLSSVIRINYFYFREDNLKNLVKLINDNFKRTTNTGFSEKTITFYDKLNRNIVLIWSIAVFFTGQFMALLPIFFISKTGRVLPLPLWYPYDWKSSPKYELTYFTQSLTQYFMGFSYGASDMFFVCVGFMIGSQFEFLSFELENVVFTALLQQNVSKQDVVRFKNDLFDKQINLGMLKIIETEKFKSDLNEILKNWVRNHQVLMKICEETENFFAPLHLPNVMLGISYNIFIMYSIVVSKSFNSTTYSLIEYIMISHTQLFCLTFIGQKLTTSSEMVLDSFWKSPWYLCDKKIQKTLLIIQIKLKKPILLTAWKFFPMALSTFLFAIKTSFSYLTFLRQVSE